MMMICSLLTIAMLLIVGVFSFRSTANLSARNVHANEGLFWKAETCEWRPDVNDVERIIWGKPAKKKQTGSRGAPYRLNEGERFLYDQARQKGFLELPGSGWRSQRNEAPLLNTYRSLCDARAQASIVLHKRNTGLDDLVVDLSPLRLPETFQGVAEVCLAERAGGEIAGQELFLSRLESIIKSDYNSSLEEDEESKEELAEQESFILRLESIIDSDYDSLEEEKPNVEPSSDWMTRPICQLPEFSILWNDLPRAEAKALGKRMAELFKTSEGKLSRSKRPLGVKTWWNSCRGVYGI